MKITHFSNHPLLRPPACHEDKTSDFGLPLILFYFFNAYCFKTIKSMKSDVSFFFFFQNLNILSFSTVTDTKEFIFVDRGHFDDLKREQHKMRVET